MDFSAWGAEVVRVLVRLVTVVLVYYLRRAIPKIPRFFLPILAVAIGSAADYLGTTLTGQVWSPFVGALLGAAATWLRELVTTAQHHGLRP